MEKAIVVMAAGVGSRFGGLKQATPIDAEENFILDYSVYDAIKYGFTKVVFIIREEFLELFKSTIGKRLEGKIKVEYAFQKIEDIPISLDISNRTKPWGTVQALLSAKPYVNGQFIVLNADDFYGENAFREASLFLDNNKDSYTYACLSYEYGVTKSLEGSVKRGLLEFSKDNIITSIKECSIGYESNKLIARPLINNDSFEIKEDAPVSMNLFAFQNDVFDLLEEYYNDYFKQDKETILNGEVLLPECLMENIKKDKIKIINQPSNSLWIGMTYKSDLDIVKEKIKELKEKGVYKNSLWG